MSELVRAYTSKHADRTLSGPLSEDLPENIHEIEVVIGKALIEGKLSDSDQAEFIRGVRELLKAKGLLPDWDLADLAPKIMQRITLGYSSWIRDVVDEKRQELMSIYNKIKDRPSVQSVVKIAGGLTQEALLVVKSIAEIDEFLAKGGTYADAFNSIVYCDDIVSNLSFLKHVEEKAKIEIESAKQLQELAQLNEYEFKDIEQSYIMALECRYDFALDKALLEGAKYQDLLSITPESFGLPSKWMREGEEYTQASMIRRTIFHTFQLGEQPYRRPSFREVAKKLQAPYSEVLKASEYYNLGVSGETDGTEA